LEPVGWGTMVEKTLFLLPKNRGFVKNGVVDDLPAEMDDAKLEAAVETVLARHPREVVIVYLHAFYEMNEAHWPNLKALLGNDTRLQLGG